MSVDDGVAVAAVVETGCQYFTLDLRVVCCEGSKQKLRKGEEQGLRFRCVGSWSTGSHSAGQGTRGAGVGEIEDSLDEHSVAGSLYASPSHMQARTCALCLGLLSAAYLSLRGEVRGGRDNQDVDESNSPDSAASAIV